MQAGHHSAMAGAGLPYDYRVAYFESVAAAASSRGYFELPWVWDLNPAIPKEEGLVDVDAEILNSDFSYSMSVGWSPSVTSYSGDIQMAGHVHWYGLWVWLNKWRPAGIVTWPPQVSQSQIPISGGNVVRVVYSPHGYDMDDSAGRTASASYTHSPISLNPSNRFRVFASPSFDPNTYRAGFRFFHTSVMNAHPTYGFKANYICVVKDGVPCIYDTVNGRFFPKLGGDIVVGPQVPPNWDHMTWTEPS